MAPSLPIYTRKEIEEHTGIDINNLNNDNIGKNCELKELIQNQCTYDGNNVKCLPFKRIFLQCLQYYGDNEKIIGYKLQSKRGLENIRDNKSKYRNIEITKREDNVYDINDNEINEFIKVDEVFQRKIKEYYNKQ